MKKQIIALGVAVAMMFALGCSENKTETKVMKQVDLTAKATPTEVPKAVTVTPTPEATPKAEEPQEVTPTPEPTHEIKYNARLYAYVIPEPTPEPEVIDSCFDEDVEHGEYHDDVPATDSGQYVGDWTITFYCPCSICNGSYTGTASGAPLTPWHTCACTALPFGTVVYIEGVGTFVVEDTGVSGNWIDCCVSSHDEALALGMRTASVYIVG